MATRRERRRALRKAQKVVNGRKQIQGLGVLSPKEQSEAFEEARKLVEKIIPFLEDIPPQVEGMTLQLLVARSGVRMQRTPEEVMRVLAANIPQLMIMLERAYAEAEADYESLQKKS